MNRFLPKAAFMERCQGAITLWFCCWFCLWDVRCIMRTPLACQQAASEETFYNGEKKQLFGSRMNDFANFSKTFHIVQLVVKWTALYNVQINGLFKHIKVILHWLCRNRETCICLARKIRIFYFSLPIMYCSICLLSICNFRDLSR